MILTKDQDLENIRLAGRLTGEVLEIISKAAAPGMTTWELDELAEKTIRGFGHIPTFKGYRKFPGTVCISVNEEVVHGIPSKKKVLKDGDVVSLDIGVSVRTVVDGKNFDFIGDSAITVPIGKVTDRIQRMLDDTQASLYAGIKAARGHATLDDVGGAVEDIGKAGQYGIVRDYGGHGIGPDYHEDPFIFNYRTGSKTKLKPGMVIAIEPMFNLGGHKVRTKSDGWTVVTQDYKPSAHFEHSLLITEGEPEILTKRPSEVIL
jgi:methionyl aminopeptidase